jgi:hypothetical protein
VAPIMLPFDQHHGDLLRVLDRRVMILHLLLLLTAVHVDSGRKASPKDVLERRRIWKIVGR